MHAAPPVVYLLVIVGYFVGLVVAGAVATLLWPGRKLAAALIVGILFTLINIVNVQSVPEPMWVSVASFLTFIPGALMGGWPVRSANVKRTPFVVK